MAELDVQELADGELVVMHAGEVDGLSLADIKVEDFRALVPAHCAPRLEDVLDRVDLPFDIEIKQADPIRVLATVLRGARAQCIFTSFDPAAISAIGAEAPESVRGLLVQADDELVSLDDAALAAQLVSRATSAGASVIAMQANLATPPTLAAVAEVLAPSIVWTVNDRKEFQSFLGNPSVAGVVTDRLDLITEARAAESPASADL